MPQKFFLGIICNNYCCSCFVTVRITFTCVLTVQAFSQKEFGIFPWKTHFHHCATQLSDHLSLCLVFIIDLSELIRHCCVFPPPRWWKPNYPERRCREAVCSSESVCSGKYQEINSNLMLTLWLKERWLSSDTQCRSETCELLKRSKRVQRAHLNAFALPVHVQWTRSLCMATAFTARSFSYCFFMDSFLFLSSKTNKTKQEYITGGKYKEGMVFGVVRCSHHGLQWYLRCCFNTVFFFALHFWQKFRTVV